MSSLPLFATHLFFGLLFQIFSGCIQLFLVSLDVVLETVVARFLAFSEALALLVDFLCAENADWERDQITPDTTSADTGETPSSRKDKGRPRDEVDLSGVCEFSLGECSLPFCLLCCRLN